MQYHRSTHRHQKGYLPCPSANPLFAGGEWEVRYEDWYADGAKISNTERRMTDRELRRYALRAASFSRAVARLHFEARALLDNDEL